MAETEKPLVYCVMGVSISIVILIAMVMGDKKDLPIFSVFLSAVVILTIILYLDQRFKKN